MVHSQARALVEAGYAATIVAAALVISRSSLYHGRNRERVERIGSGMSRSCRRAERSQLTAVDGWPGGCAGRNGFA